MGRVLLAPLSSGLTHIPGSSITPHAGEMLVHSHATALPAQGSATLTSPWPCTRSSLWLPIQPGSSQAQPHPLPHCVLWVLWSWKDMGTWSTGTEMGETGTNHD